MSEPEDLKARLETLERRNRWLLVLVCVLAVGAVTGAARSLGTQDVVRTRGLVVVDEEGNERVVVGAPMGEASDDPKLKDAVGLAVKDTAGRLNVAVGARSPAVLPGGEVVERVRSGVGVTVYDPRTGGERGGFGAMEDGGALLCLDYAAEPKEAACVSVAPEDRHAAFYLNGTPGEDAYDRASMVVGADGAGVIKILGTGEHEGGVRIETREGRLPSLMVYDSAGNVARDLIRRD